MPDAAEPLRRNHDFTLLWTGQAVSSVGSRISDLAIPLLVLSMTGSPATAGLVGLFATLPTFLFQLPAGVLVDRWDRRRVMVVSDTLRAILMGAVAVSLAAGFFSVVLIAAVAFAEGAVAVFYRLAERAALRSVVPVAQMHDAVARNEARQFGAGLIGGPLGGALYSLGRVVPFAVDAISYAASIVAALLVRSDLRPPPRQDPRSLHREMRDGFRWLFDQPFLRTCSLFIACANTIMTAMTLIVIVRARELGASPSVIGVMFAVASLGGVAGAALAPGVQRRLPARRVVVGANWVWALLLPLFAIAPNALVLGVLEALMLTVAPIWNVTVVAYRMSIVPPGLQARVQSVALLVATAGMPLGQPIAGVLLGRFGGQETILVVAAVTLLLAIAGSFSRPLRHPPGVTAADLATS